MMSTDQFNLLTKLLNTMTAERRLQAFYAPSNANPLAYNRLIAVRLVQRNHHALVPGEIYVPMDDVPNALYRSLLRRRWARENTLETFGPSPPLIYRMALGTPEAADAFREEFRRRWEGGLSVPTGGWPAGVSTANVVLAQ